MQDKLNKMLNKIQIPEADENLNSKIYQQSLHFKQYTKTYKKSFFNPLIVSLASIFIIALIYFKSPVEVDSSVSYTLADINIYTMQNEQYLDNEEWGQGFIALLSL